MILCIETATSVCSVALMNGDKIVSIREDKEGFSHSEKLTVFISEITKESGIVLKDLKAIAVSSGPGSYTGLRIGVSVSKGLCYALDKPLIGISTLEAMAYGAIMGMSSKIKSHPDSNRESKFKNEVAEIENMFYCPMIDARRMEVYCALYDSKMNCLHNPSAVVVTENFFYEYVDKKKIAYFGDGAEKCKNILTNNFDFNDGIYPSAEFMGQIASDKYAKSQFENLALFEPVYLKEYRPGMAKTKL
jgi:tRNA threonylcarbamoyladenosine biosynthesis protein TsaB